MPDTRIMVVDDDTDTLEFMVTLLEEHGYCVLPYTTTADIVAQVLHYQPHLVILDIHFHTPMIGWDLFQALRASVATAHIPVLLYSCKHTFLHNHRDEVRSLHGDVLKKPFDMQALLAKIEALMNTDTK